MSADQRAQKDTSVRLSDRINLSQEDARVLEEEAQRLNVSTEDFIKQIVEEIAASRPPGTTGQANPDELVREAVQTFIAKRKGERPPNM